MKNTAIDKHKSEKPAQVVNAVRLLYVSLGLTALNIFLQTARSIAAKVSIGPAIFDLIIIFGIQLYLIMRIAGGKDWARLAYLAWYLVSLVYSLFLFLPVLREPSSPFLLQTLFADLPAGILNLVQNVLEIIALVLVFQGPANEWFRGQKVQ